MQFRHSAAVAAILGLSLCLVGCSPSTPVSDTQPSSQPQAQPEQSTPLPPPAWATVAQDLQDASLAMRASVSFQPPPNMTVDEAQDAKEKLDTAAAAALVKLARSERNACGSTAVSMIDKHPECRDFPSTEIDDEVSLFVAFNNELEAYNQLVVRVIRDDDVVDNIKTSRGTTALNDGITMP